MAAPSDIKWGSIVGDYGKIGIYTSVNETNTKLELHVEVWFASRYSVSDSSNTYYYDNRSSSGSATTNRGSKTIKTTVASGEGWSTSNHVKLAEADYTYTKGTSASTRYLYAKLANVDRVGGTMYVSKTVSIPALDKYTITYNVNGGTGTVNSHTKYHGKSVTLANGSGISKSGYSFQGWGTSNTDTSVDYKAGASYSGNDNLTLYAIWKKTITLSYNANGGSASVASQSASVYNAKTSYKFTITSNKPGTKTGHTFLGWSTNQKATSASYSGGAKITLSAPSTTLYAVWKPDTYTISYNANGGSGAPGADTKTYGVALTLSKTIPTRNGYIFLGWGTATNSTTPTYQAGGSYPANANANAILYAVWASGYTKPRIFELAAGRLNAGERVYLGVVDGDLIYYCIVNDEYNDSTYYQVINDSGSYTRTNTILDSSSVDNKLTWSNNTIVYLGIWNNNEIYYSITDTGEYFRCDRVVESDGSISMLIVEQINESDVQDVRTASGNSNSAKIYFEWICDNADPEINIVCKTSTDVVKKVTNTVSGNRGVHERYFYDLDPEKSYTFVVKVDDGEGSNSTTIIVSSAQYPIDVKSEGKGISFGKAAELEDTADFGWAIRPSAGYDHPFLEPETNLDDVLTPNTYIGANVSTYNYVNCPFTSGTFTLEVVEIGEVGQRRQRLQVCHKTNPIMYERHYHKTDGEWTWGEWLYVGWIKPSITVYNNTTYPLTMGSYAGSNNYPSIPFNSVLTSTSAVLSISDGSVKIGPGIQYVKVSGQLRFDTGTNDSNYRYARLRKISAGKNKDFAWVSTKMNTSTYNPMYFTPSIISVMEGDLISMVVYSTDSGDKIYSSGSVGSTGPQTYLTVEAL